MIVYEAICIEDYRVEGITDDGTTEVLELKYGQQYTVSGRHKNDPETRTVFTRYWTRVPARIFAGVRQLRTHEPEPEKASEPR